MAAVSASLVASIGDGFGRIELCWRPLNMSEIASSLSPTQMITCLETVQSLLENYPCSLSDYEKGCLIRFATSVAESMESNLNGPIIISLCSAITDVNTVRRVQERLRVAHHAVSSMMPGEWDKYYKELSLHNQPPTSLDI